ncbi:dNA-binding helix-turn-helix protein [Clostridium sp. CAG:1013]|nr:dNA-binding helix-turn-helix protein [Clostridium sp. CAG:1013]
MIEFNKFAVGHVIRRLRKDRGLSQEVFSGLAGIARSHLAMIESGSKQANFETVWRISNAFGMFPHEFVCLVEVEIQREEKMKQA